MLKALQRMRDALATKNKKLGRPMTPTGGEIHDPTPVAPPIGYNPSLSFEERIRIAIRSEHMAAAAERDGRESYAEFNDFGDEIDDDEIFPSSRFEQVAMDARRLGAEYQRSKAERERIAQAEDRLAKKIGEAVQTNLDYQEFEESLRPRVRRRPASGARRREAPEGRPEEPTRRPHEDDDEPLLPQ